jgi:TolB-like protein/DNA-binding winged helix-turn-helix (wHTH) protein/Flp pilus assembly protein TadD
MQTKQIYEFGPFRLDPAEHILLREGKLVSLTPKAFETLAVLVENNGHLIGKEELIRRVWPDTIVEEGNLNNIIYMLRKALGHESDDGKYIETISKRGYRFVAEVRRAPDGPQAEAELIATHALSLSGESSGASALSAAPAFSPAVVLPRSWRARPNFIPMAAGLFVCALTIVLFFVWRSNRTLEPSAPATVSSPPIRSVAVLPFRVLSAEKDDEYLSLGLADALITSLSHTRQLVVRQTSAVSKYAKAEKDPLEAGREQGVEAVLDGQVQRIGERVRITARLVRTSDGASLWADRFDEQFTHVFAVEDAIAEKVAQAMIRTIAGGAEQKPLSPNFPRRYTENNEAYQAYLKGRHFWNKRTTASFQQAATHFQQAVRLDPNYALAYVGLADTYTLLSFFTIAAPNDVFPKAKEAAAKALAIDPTLAEAYVALGQVKAVYEWDWDGAEKQFQKGLALNANDPNLHHWRSLNLMAMGRLEDARAAMLRALKLDPLLLITNVNLGRIDYYAGRYDQAIEQYRRAIDLDSNFARAHLRLGMAFVQQSRYKEAIAEYQKTREISGDTPQVTAHIAQALALSGKKSEARALLAELKQRATRQYVPSYSLALIHIGLGENEAAFAWLEKAYADRSSEMIYFKVEPMLAPLRSDPRYQDILRRMRLAG